MAKFVRERITGIGPRGVPGDMTNGPGTVTFGADGTITETRPEGISTTTTFNADGSITTVYGRPLNRTIRTTFNPDGSITEARV